MRFKARAFVMPIYLRFSRFCIYLIPNRISGSFVSIRGIRSDCALLGTLSPLGEVRQQFILITRASRYLRHTVSRYPGVSTVSQRDAPAGNSARRDSLLLRFAFLPSIRFGASRRRRRPAWHTSVRNAWFSGLLRGDLPRPSAPGWDGRAGAFTFIQMTPIDRRPLAFC